jgi:tRNA-dihydrouridine synthase B
MKIANYELNSPYILPAIAGFSDMPMRELCYRYGAGLCFTEMVSAKGLVYGSDNSGLMLITGENERIRAIQLFGGDPHFFEKAILDERLKKFDIVDINMGCPVPKIVKNGEGSALMKNPELAYEIIKISVEAAQGRPVTVKMRAGFSLEDINACKIAELAEKAGASCVTVHGRVREQYYSGDILFSAIRDVKNSVGIPVIGNGNVHDKNTAFDMFEKTGCDGVAIARAAIGKPDIFAELTGQTFEKDLAMIIKEHFEGLLSYLPEQVAVNNFKKHFVSYLKAYKGSKNLKNLITASCSKKDVMDVLRKVEDLTKGLN